MDAKSKSSGAREVKGRQKTAEAVVRCKGFQCLAYRDKEGKWRGVSGEEVLEVLEVVLRF